MAANKVHDLIPPGMNGANSVTIVTTTNVTYGGSTPYCLLNSRKSDFTALTRIKVRALGFKTTKPRALDLVDLLQFPLLCILRGSPIFLPLISLIKKGNCTDELEIVKRAKIAATWQAEGGGAAPLLSHLKRASSAPHAVLLEGRG